MCIRDRIGAAFTGVNNAYVYNNATAWGLGSSTNKAVIFDRGTSTYSYGGFDLPTPAASGYITLPNGLVIQWGRTTVTGMSGTSASGTASYPIAFPSGAYQVFNSIVTYTAGSTSSLFVRTYPGNASTFNYNSDFSAGTTGVVFSFLAIGH